MPILPRRRFSQLNLIVPTISYRSRQGNTAHPYNKKVSELRWHPLFREWVVVAPVRQDRPQMPKNWCPFDPGSGRVPDHYDVHLYPNDFPAFNLDNPPFEPKPELFGVTGAR